MEVGLCYVTLCLWKKDPSYLLTLYSDRIPTGNTAAGNTVGKYDSEEEEQSQTPNQGQGT